MQTAIDFLVEKLNKLETEKHLYKIIDYRIKKQSIVEQAKAMEKDQIMKFAIKAVTNAVNEDINNPYNLEQLFAKTYGSNGSDDKQ